MDRAEIGELDGVALAEAVADMVMKWQPCSDRGYADGSWWVDGGAQKRQVSDGADRYYGFRPDIDHNHAAEVMVKCCERWPGWGWVLLQEYRKNTNWRAIFSSNEHSKDYDVFNPALCVAICRVALLAALELEQG